MSTNIEQDKKKKSVLSPESIRLVQVIINKCRSRRCNEKQKNLLTLETSLSYGTLNMMYTAMLYRIWQRAYLQ